MTKMTNSQLKSVCIDALMHQHNIISKPKMIKIMKDLNGIDYLILQKVENGYLRTYVFIIERAEWYEEQYGRYQQPITLKLCSQPIKK